MRVLPDPRVRDGAGGAVTRRNAIASRRPSGRKPVRPRTGRSAAGAGAVLVLFAWRVAGCAPRPAAQGRKLARRCRPRRRSCGRVRHGLAPAAASLGARRAPAIRPWLSVAGQNGRIEHERDDPDVRHAVLVHPLPFVSARHDSPNAESCRILHFSALAETLPDWDSLCNNEIAGPRVAGCRTPPRESAARQCQIVDGSLTF